MPQSEAIRAAETLPVLAMPDPEAALDTLVDRYLAANGLLMQVVGYVGGQVEDVVSRLPAKARERVETATRTALEVAYGAAYGSQRLRAGDRPHRMMAAAFGAIGGFGGLPTALTELPVTTTLMLRSIQEIALFHDEDLSRVETRLACLQVLGAGGPLTEDDGTDYAFLGARIAITGPAINTLIARIAPRFAAVLTQKLGAKSVPLIGSFAGAGTNLAFMRYYQEMAHIHFGLRRLARQGALDAPAAFKARVEAVRALRKA
jgi:hypothetical protein